CGPRSLGGERTAGVPPSAPSQSLVSAIVASEGKNLRKKRLDATTVPGPQGSKTRHSRTRLPPLSAKGALGAAAGAGAANVSDLVVHPLPGGARFELEQIIHRCGVALGDARVPVLKALAALVGGETGGGARLQELPAAGAGVIAVGIEGEGILASELDRELARARQHHVQREHLPPLRSHCRARIEDRKSTRLNSSHV